MCESATLHRHSGWTPARARHVLPVLTATTGLRSASAYAGTLRKCETRAARSGACSACSHSRGEIADGRRTVMRFACSGPVDHAFTACNHHGQGTECRPCCPPANGHEASAPPRARQLLVAASLCTCVVLAAGVVWFAVSSRQAAIDDAVREMRTTPSCSPKTRIVCCRRPTACNAA